MGSPNAFAKMSSAHSRSASVLSEQDLNARSPKRPRLAEEVIAAIHTQCAQNDTSLEVDHLVLDYIAFNTIRTSLASRNVESTNSSPSSHIALSNAFISIFKSRHPDYQPDPELRFRMLVLKFATLFTQRFTSNPATPSLSALVKLRAENNLRAVSWISRSPESLPSSTFDPTPLDDDLPIPVADMERNRAHVLHQLGVPAEDEHYEDPFYATSSCLSLLDLLPLFMDLTAARNAIGHSNLTQRWMHLACEFMLQACLEQYLVYGAQGSDAVDQAFAWGYQETSADAMDLDETNETIEAVNTSINAMFEDEEYSMEVEGWKELKAAYIESLVPASRVSEHNESFQKENHGAKDVVTHLESVAAAHPVSSFESTLLNYLEAMSQSIPEPVLTQLEQGKLDGMSKQQTQQFLTNCGIDVADCFG